MRVERAPLDGVLMVFPDVYPDDRGLFMETYREVRYAQHGISSRFVQDNLSKSCRGTLRGLHFQQPRPQAKLIQVVRGDIFDVCVDIRHGSPDFGRWLGIALSADNPCQLFVPEGFAHGFCALSDDVLVLYKCSDIYVPECDAGILWSDPDLQIDWPVKDPLLSPKDRGLPQLRDVPSNRLPRYTQKPT